MARLAATWPPKSPIANRSATICTGCVAMARAAVLAAPGAVARPGIDPRPSASADGASATPQSITFTNPLHRSRGPGAGMGLL